MKTYGEDTQADRVIDRLLSGSRAAQATVDTNAGIEEKSERRHVARALREPTKSPLVLDLVRQFGKVPKSVLDEMAARKMRWGI